MSRLIDAEVLVRKLKSWNFGHDLPYWIQKCIDDTPTVEIKNLTTLENGFFSDCGSSGSNKFH